MRNFLRSLFGSKKSISKIKPRMQSRRLELLGLEERIVPATISVNNQTVVITLVAGEIISDLHTAQTGANQVTITTTTTSNNTPTGLIVGTGVTVANQSIIVDTTSFAFDGISVVGQAGGSESVTIGALGIDLSSGSGGGKPGSIHQFNSDWQY